MCRKEATHERRPPMHTAPLPKLCICRTEQRPPMPKVYVCRTKQSHPCPRRISFVALHVSCFKVRMTVHEPHADTSGINSQLAFRKNESSQQRAKTYQRWLGGWPGSARLCSARLDSALSGLARVGGSALLGLAQRSPSGPPLEFLICKDSWSKKVNIPCT